MPEEYIPELKEAAESIGLNWADFKITDNTCKPHPPAASKPTKVPELLICFAAEHCIVAQGRVIVKEVAIFAAAVAPCHLASFEMWEKSLALADSKRERHCALPVESAGAFQAVCWQHALRMEAACAAQQGVNHMVALLLNPLSQADLCTWLMLDSRADSLQCSLV